MQENIKNITSFVLDEAEKLPLMVKQFIVTWFIVNYAMVIYCCILILSGRVRLIIPLLPVTGEVT
jgi:hypothetical protein